LISTLPVRPPHNDRHCSYLERRPDLGHCTRRQAMGYFPPLRHALPQLFSTFVNWFTYPRPNPGHPEIHRMA
jgi:hypothetical protein